MIKHILSVLFPPFPTSAPPPLIDHDHDRNMTQVQAESIPVILQGVDCFVKARTGTGKERLRSAAATALGRTLACPCHVWRGARLANADAAIGVAGVPAVGGFAAVNLVGQPYTGGQPERPLASARPGLSASHCTRHLAPV